MGKILNRGAKSSKHVINRLTFQGQTLQIYHKNSSTDFRVILPTVRPTTKRDLLGGGRSLMLKCVHSVTSRSATYGAQ